MPPTEDHNPNAPRRSAVIWAVSSAAAFCLYGLVRYWYANMPVDFLYVILPWMAVWGAVTGVAMKCHVEGEEDGGSPGKSRKQKP